MAGLRLWLILAASLYDVVAVLLFGVSVANSHISARLLVLFVLVMSGPALMLWGVIKWAGSRAWLARAAGELLMLVGLLPLFTISALLFPFVAVSLVGVGPWRAPDSGRSGGP